MRKFCGNCPLGVARDGWTVAGSTTDGSVGITTRQTRDCPDQITSGFDLDLDEDNTLRISCV